MDGNNKVVLCTCNLNQWAMDFDGNYERIKSSILLAKKIKGCKFRLGPELEISGYSCEDHFLELDTFHHSAQTLALILQDEELTKDILCDIGCPILHNNVRYNCRVFVLNRQIVLIRPKIYLADDGNYREKRFFASWDRNDDKVLRDHVLSDMLREATYPKQTVVPIGIGIIATQETLLASEICEELWTANSPHIQMYLSGVEIIANASGSHHELRKLNSRLTLMKNATSKCGGAYLYSNHRGCDGNRLYFDGCSSILVNGELVAQASQFSMKEVEVVSAVVDLDAIRTYRGVSASLQEQSSRTTMLPVVDLRHFSLRPSEQAVILSLSPSPPVPIRIHLPEEECAMGPACWLWDYLRRANAGGFLLPLSGGADSASVAAIVRVSCEMAASEALEGNEQVLVDITRLLVGSVGAGLNHEVKEILSNVSSNSASKSIFAKDLADALCNRVLHTVYMGSEKNSSAATRERAQRLADSIHSYHSTLQIDGAVNAILSIFQRLTNKSPRYLTNGGSLVEDLALQNVQARLRMVLAYLCAILFPWCRGHSGFLLVLGSANVDEALRGYMTKYDCSSADVNPIGGMSKGDLKRMLIHTARVHRLPALEEIATAVPTAELRPIEGDVADNYHSQTDEADMGMTYEELGVFGRLRKVLRCGPVRMFLTLVDTWKATCTPAVVAEKVKRFFYFYSLNRHKLTVLTPSYHAESYSPDDNRFDLRQFLYNTKWTRQFDTIDDHVALLSSRPATCGEK